MPKSVQGWEGYWVALDGDEVLDAAHNAQELVARLHAMGPRAAEATVEYVPMPTDVITIGVG